MVKYVHILAALWSPAGNACAVDSFVSDVFSCVVTFPYVVWGQVWYFIVLIPDSCLLPYFKLICLYYIFMFTNKIVCLLTLCYHTKVYPMLVHIVNTFLASFPCAIH